MPRRPNQQGSAYHRKDGRWEARLPLGDGKRWMVTVRTRKEAYERLNAAIKDRQAGLRPQNERITVAEFLARWLDESALPSVRPGTYASYERLVRVHLIPELGRLRLARLTPDLVQAALNRRREAGQTPANIAKMRTVLRRALTIGQRWGLIHQNAAALSEPPRLERHRAHPLSPGEARAFLRSVQGDPFEAYYIMAVMTGLRRGELLGLLWPSVDLDAGQVTVSRQLLRLKVDQRWSLELVESPKTDRSLGKLALPVRAVEALREHRSRQAAVQLQASRWGSPLGHFVFATNAGTPLDPDNVTKRIKRALRRVGLDDRRPHDLRATFGSLLQDQHVDLKTISHLMRHSTIRLTADTYLDVMDQAGRDAAAILDRLLRGA